MQAGLIQAILCSLTALICINIGKVILYATGLREQFLPRCDRIVDCGLKSMQQ
jgi:hypothetical protein